MKLYWIPIIWFFLGAIPSPSPAYLPSTSGISVAKLWVVLSNSKWRACCWPAKVVARFWAKWGNCGLTQAHCAVVNRAFVEYLVQQWTVTKVNSYLVTDVVWELFDKLFPHCKKYFMKTTHLPETTVLTATSYLPKCSYLEYCKRNSVVHCEIHIHSFRNLKSHPLDSSQK